jgi:hypothetical protein
MRMKVESGYQAAKRRRAKFELLEQWQRWYAWHPVEIGGEQGFIVWLEPVERRYIGPLWGWQYRIIEGDINVR